MTYNVFGGTLSLTQSISWVHLEEIQVKFICEGHWVKVKVME